MRVIFFLKMLKIESKFREWKKEKKNAEKIFVSEIFEAENVAIN